LDADGVAGGDGLGQIGQILGSSYIGGNATNNRTIGKFRPEQMNKIGFDRYLPDRAVPIDNSISGLLVEIVRTRTEPGGETSAQCRSY